MQIKHSIEIKQLKSGAILLNIMIRDLPISIVSAWFNVGSRQDPEGKEGLAHLLEHLFMQQTKSFPDSIKRLQSLESSGIKYNAFTGYEATHFYHVQSNEQTFVSLGLLLDGLNNTIFSEKALKEEKKIVISEFADSKANPRSYIWNLAYQSLWKNSNMGKSFFGSTKSINSITLEDLEIFVQNNYVADKCLIVVAGNEDSETLAAFIDENLNLKSGAPKKIIKEEYKQIEVEKIERTLARQVLLSVSFKTAELGNFTEIAQLDLIRDYLANKWISKLIEILRFEKHYSYWVDGESYYFTDTGILSLIYSTDKENATDSIMVVLGEIEKIKTKSLDEKNLQMFKISLLSSAAIRFTDPYEFVLWYGNQIALLLEEREVLTLERYLELIEKTTGEDLRKTAAKYLRSENMSIVAIGDVEKK